MRKVFFRLTLILILCFCFVACSCNIQKTSGLSLTAFNTTVYVQTSEKALNEQTKNQLKTLISQLDDDFSISKENSFTSRFNALHVGQSISLTQTELQVLLACKDYYEFSNGKFNPAIRELIELWQFDQRFPIFTPPSQENIDEALTKIDFTKIVLDQTQRTVTKTAEVKLDFGGILKGYCAEQALAILKNNGYSKGYVNVGSSSIALLNASELGVRHPRATDDNPLIITIDTKNLADVFVSSSGDYEKYHVYNGKKYSHILDPITGSPADTGIVGATVIVKDGGFSDAITTALCTLSHNPNDLNSSNLVQMMNKITERFTNAHIYVVYIKDGVKNVITNKKQGENFTLHDTDFTVVNI